MIHFVGIDNGNKAHCVNIKNQLGENLKNFTIENKLAGFQKLLEELKKLENLHIGIESVNNTLTDFLRKYGYNIYNLNPLKIKRFKEVNIVSGNKTDKIDSEVLSDYLRLNHEKLKSLTWSSDLVEELKQYGVVHNQLTKEHTRLVNQLISASGRGFPILRELFTSSAPKILLKLILQYPSWEALKNAPEEEIVDFLKKNHYRTAKYIEKTLNIIKKRKQYVCHQVESAYPFLLMTTAENLLNIKKRLEEIENRMKELLNKHPLGEIFLSLPGAGTVTAAKLLGFIGDNKDRFKTVDNMRCLFGTAPRNYQSGGYHKVSMRRACKKSVRNLLYFFAFSSLKHSGWARSYYDQQRKKGKTNSVALRSLSDRWLRKIYFLWKNEVKYDESVVQKHAA